MDEGEENFENPELEDDPDFAYEMMRDTCSENLENDIKEVLKNHYKKSGYYSGMKDRLKQHATEIIKSWRSD